MKSLATIISIVCVVVCLSTPARAQEGRPALAAETVEDARVLQILHDSLPREFEGWTIDSETAVEGARHFHDGGEAVRYPFHHDYRVAYSLDRQSSRAATLLAAYERGELSLEGVDAASHVTISVAINTFEVSGRSSAAIERLAVPPFDLALWGVRGAQLLIGPWTLVRNQRTVDGSEYEARATRSMTLSMGQIQCLSMQIVATPETRQQFLDKIDLGALSGLIGSSPLQRRAATSAVVPLERPLAVPAPGVNEFSYHVSGDGFPAQTVVIKPSVPNQQAYLRNDFPDPAVTENAVTRLLVQEDTDTVKRTPYPVADITVPFIRRTGTFTVAEGQDAVDRGTFMVAIGCWNGCEWGIHPVAIEVTITRYDAVGGFVEGTFRGTGTAVYRENQTIDDHRNLAVTISDGHFKIRRKADRY